MDHAEKIRERLRKVLDDNLRPDDRNSIFVFPLTFYAIYSRAKRRFENEDKDVQPLLDRLFHVVEELFESGFHLCHYWIIPVYKSSKWYCIFVDLPHRKIAIHAKRTRDKRGLMIQSNIKEFLISFEEVMEELTADSEHSKGQRDDDDNEEEETLDSRIDYEWALETLTFAEAYSHSSVPKIRKTPLVDVVLHWISARNSRLIMK